MRSLGVAPFLRYCSRASWIKSLSGRPSSTARRLARRRIFLRYCADLLFHENSLFRPEDQPQSAALPANRRVLSDPALRLVSQTVRLFTLPLIPSRLPVCCTQTGPGRGGFLRFPQIDCSLRRRPYPWIGFVIPMPRSASQTQA